VVGVEAAPARKLLFADIYSAYLGRYLIALIFGSLLIPQAESKWQVTNSVSPAQLFDSEL
jgi:hypothetical protein